MDLDRELNPEQKAAVLHPQGPLLILAGAGSGKTRVITYRIAHLVGERGVPPGNILAVTFTNKAAREMRERVERLLGAEAPSWISTFHAFGARLLRRHAELLGYSRDFLIYDEDDARRLGREVTKAMGLDPQQYPVEELLAQVERAKRNLKGPGEGGIRFGPASAFYARYQERLRKNDALDFSDLIRLSCKLLCDFPAVLSEYQRRFEHVLVDEFQDTDPAQYRLLRLLCPPEANLCVVGDDDQSIYSWRGAEVRHILGFAQDYPGCRVVKLEQNYRSTPQVLETASRVIAGNRERHEKTLWTGAPAGAPVELYALSDERAEGELAVRLALSRRERGEKLSGLAVLYRTNAQSRAFEEAFRVFGVPYLVVGGVRFFDRAEIRDAVAYLRLLQNPKSDVDLLRVINVPPRGIGDTTRERLSEIAARHGCQIFESLTEERLSGLRRPEREKALSFAALLRALRDECQNKSAVECVRRVLEKTGYLKMLESSESEQAQGRYENLQELASAAQEFATLSGDPSLAAFLEHVSLLTDLDGARGEAEAVTLMTLHSAKGLEFDEVLLAGLEEGLLPHRRSLKEDEDGTRRGALEEERRLCYVGMTRARKRLVLSYAWQRAVFGRVEMNPPSRFLDLLPGGVRRVGGMEEPAEDEEAFEELSDDDGVFLDAEDEPPPPEPTRGRARPSAATPGRVRPKTDRDGQNWIGRFVAHDTFGRGLVRAACQTRLGLKLTVDFEDAGEKTILADYVKRL
ncbi:MAG: UvrD-helicase domain-containing protein [Myxococcales bacterium]|nr:UvrD-helicase domain-containing protein [Myxococcales bacterium]